MVHVDTELQTLTVLPSLLPHQLEAVDVLLERGRLLLADEQGTGKSPIAVVACQKWEAKRVLLVCMKNLIPNWKNFFRVWGPEYVVHTFEGTPSQRAVRWEDFKHEEGNKVLLTNYAQLKNIVALETWFDVVIFDECQKIKSRKTVGFKSAQKLKFHKILLMSGTPNPKGPEDLWAYLHLMNPKEFRGFWPWAEKHLQSWEAFGTKMFGRPKDPHAFREMLKPYILRRLKKDVLDLPPKTRDPLYTDMTPAQEKMYKDIQKDMVAETEDSYLIVSNPAERNMRLRQIAVNPVLVGGANSSGAFNAIHEFVEDLQRPLVIYTCFPSVFPYLEEMLADHKEVPQEVYKIRGGMKDNAYWDALQKFEKSQNNQRTLLVSLTTAAGFDIFSSSYGLLLGFDYVVDNNLQAEDRQHRQGVTAESVNFYYIITRGTVDLAVVQACSERTDVNKIIWEHLTGRRKIDEDSVDLNWKAEDD